FQNDTRIVVDTEISISSAFEAFLRSKPANLAFMKSR
ncbi:MAG: hypothetical protein ACI87E_004736, partial [Mariniblastus sp.]